MIVKGTLKRTIEETRKAANALSDKKIKQF